MSITPPPNIYKYIYISNSIFKNEKGCMSIYKFAPVNRGQGETEEAGHSRLEDVRFNKQGNLQGWSLMATK